MEPKTYRYVSTRSDDAKVRERLRALAACAVGSATAGF
jgi:hypothetical protein